MGNSVSLQGKRILIVDDEPDILESLREILTESILETATDFETAMELLENHPYDAAILDIMGVHGYDLLGISRKRGIPTLMLTGHALSPENFFKSIEEGAGAYIPKDKIGEIEIFLKDLLEAYSKGEKGLGTWFARLESFFEKRFGSDWKGKADTDFWKKNFYT